MPGLSARGLAERVQIVVLGGHDDKAREHQWLSPDGPGQAGHPPGGSERDGCPAALIDATERRVGVVGGPVGLGDGGGNRA